MDAVNRIADCLPRDRAITEYVSEATEGPSEATGCSPEYSDRYAWLLNRGEATSSASRRTTKAAAGDQSRDAPTQLCYRRDPAVDRDLARRECPNLGISSGSPWLAALNDQVATVWRTAARATMIRLIFTPNGAPTRLEER